MEPPATVQLLIGYRLPAGWHFPHSALEIWRLADYGTESDSLSTQGKFVAVQFSNRAELDVLNEMTLAMPFFIARGRANPYATGSSLAVRCQRLWFHRDCRVPAGGSCSPTSKRLRVA
jgi:hypothetical protein